MEIQFDGDITFLSGAVITASTGDVSVIAKGDIKFEGSAQAKSKEGSVFLSGMDISITVAAALWADQGFKAVGTKVLMSGYASVTAKSRVNITAASDLDIQDNTRIESTSNVSIVSNTVFLADGAGINAAGSVSISAGSPHPKEDNDDSLGNVHLAGSIVAQRVDVFVHGDAFLTGSLAGSPKQTRSLARRPRLKALDTSKEVAVSLVAHRNLTMDLRGGQWNTKFFWVVADHISMTNQTIKTGGSSCGNRHSSKVDQCVQYRQLTPEMVVAGAGASGTAPVKDDNVTFDLLLVAFSSLTAQSTHLAAGSMLLCAAGHLGLQTSSLDAKGRGCGPGEGQGAGSEGGKICRSGAGASHAGRGGAGASYSTTIVSKCSEAGEPDPEAAGYSILPSAVLPTAGASGGGCGLTGPCATSWDTVTSPASAGGLIWVSGADVALQGGSSIQADGTQGAANETINASDVSGGGAGGHVVLWAYSSLSLDQPALISANGGDIQCTHKQVSGAGGGGFVAIQYGGAVDISAKSPQLSARGGAMSDQCSVWPPQAGLATTYGQPGVTASILPCPGGRAGPLCATCPIGRYGDGNATCKPCTNKPEANSAYTAVQWPNSTCPYKCVAGVPDYRTNPKCLLAPSFVWQFFGGWGGALLILLCLVMVSGYFLCRRARHRKRRLYRQYSKSDFLGPCAASIISRLCSRCRDRCSCCAPSQEADGNGELIFTKEQLPYHVCRVYLRGQNDGQMPWGLGGHLPPVVEHMVLAEQWVRFAGELGRLCEIQRSERLYKAGLAFVCPPLVSALSCWYRRKRAALLQKCARCFSEGSSCDAFWKPIRARVHHGGELAMVFGCDSGATLGYLDFFDFSRSQLDYAPGDLRHDAMLLVAHGKGSYSDPFTLDMADPLVAHMSQSDFGSVAVCSVISTFNRLSRSIGADELGSAPQSPAVTCLQQKVEQCASQCGLEGFVQVFVCQQHYQPVSLDGTLPGTSGVGDNSFLDLVPPPQRGAIGQHRSAARVGTRAALMGEPGQQPPPEAVRHAEIRLCLAFVNPATLSGGAATGSAPLEALTSPMAYSQLREHLAAQCSSSGLSAIAEGEGLPGASWGAASPQSMCMQRWRQSLWKEHGSATPATVLVIVIILLTADLLAFILVTKMLVQINDGVFAVWMLVPPLTQPLALLLGPMFMLSEKPWLGRLYASMTVCGTISAAASTVALLLVQAMDTWFFNVAELATLSLLKAALYLFTNMHVRNLEAAWDMSFMEAHQADFLGNILSTESSRQVESPASGQQPPPLQQQQGRDFLPCIGSERQGGLSSGGIQLKPERKPELPSYSQLLQPRPLLIGHEGSEEAKGGGLGAGLELRGLDSGRLSAGTGRNSWDPPASSFPSEPSPF